jgi:hypothetical protein
MMRRAICFDTAPQIWGLRETSGRGQEHMISVEEVPDIEIQETMNLPDTLAGETIG